MGDQIFHFCERLDVFVPFDRFDTPIHERFPPFKDGKAKASG